MIYYLSIFLKIPNSLPLALESQELGMDPLSYLAYISSKKAFSSGVLTLSCSGLTSKPVLMGLNLSPSEVSKPVFSFKTSASDKSSHGSSSSSKLASPLANFSFCSSISASFIQRSVRSVPQYVAFDVVSRCFENKNNNCCETILSKNSNCLLFTNPFLTTLQVGHPGSRIARLWIFRFVINKQVAFFLSFVSQQLLFLFSKHLDTMSNVTYCGTSRTDLCL